MSLDAIGSDGQSIDLDSAPTVVTYNAYDQPLTVTVIWSGNTYRQTYTYAAGTITASVLVAVSAWVKQ